MSRGLGQKDYKHFYGFKRQNQLLNIYTNDLKNMVYRVDPNGVGKISTIRQKVQIIAGKCFVYDTELLKKKQLSEIVDVNPLHILAYKIFALYISTTLTQSQTQDIIQKTLRQNLIKQLGQPQLTKMQKVIKMVLNQTQGMMKILLSNNRSRLQKITFLDQYIDRQTNGTIEKTLNYLKKHQKMLQLEGQKDSKQMVTYPYFIRQKIQQIRKIQYLDQEQQITKWKIFVEKYKKVFNTALKKDRQTQKQYIQVSRPSAQPEPVLQRLSQYIDLRFQDVNYRSEAANLIRNIYTQLYQFQKALSSTKTGKIRYIDLNIDNIVFDQFQLMPKLYYEPILLDAIGLKQKPTSAECRISFNPTPKGFDYFRAPMQLTYQWKKVSTDPLYGNLELKMSRDLKLTRDEIEEIQNQRQIQHSYKQQILSWRFLLVAYYINYAQQFGRKKEPGTLKQEEQYFLQKTFEKQKRLKKNHTGTKQRKSSQNYLNTNLQLRQFLNQAAASTQRTQFNFKFQEIGYFLQREQDDSMIQTHHVNKLTRYNALHWGFNKQISLYLYYNKVPIFDKLINAKRYLILYLSLAYEIIDEQSRYIKYEKSRVGERMIIRRLMDHNIKRVGKKEPYEHLQKYYKRIQQYKNKNSQDTNYKFVKQENQYLLRKINQFEEIIRKVLNIANQLNKLEESQKKDFNRYQFLIKQQSDLIASNQPQIKIFLTQILTREFITRKNKLHLCNNNTQPLWQALIRKFVITFFAYLNLTEDNYIQYDSIIMPILQHSSRDEVKIPQSFREAHQLQQELDIIAQIINFEETEKKQIYYKVKS